MIWHKVSESNIKRQRISRNIDSRLWIFVASCTPRRLFCPKASPAGVKAKRIKLKRESLLAIIVLLLLFVSPKWLKECTSRCFPYQFCRDSHILGKSDPTSVERILPN